MIYLSVGLMVLGVILILLSLHPLITEQNYGGRLRRAPGMYFRAVGSLGAALGLLIVWLGLVLDFADKLPFAVILIGGLVIMIGEVGIVAWMMVLLKRYRLFRWEYVGYGFATVSGSFLLAVMAFRLVLEI